MHLGAFNPSIQGRLYVFVKLHRFSSKLYKLYPKNCAPAGPISTSLLTSPSPSTIGGGYARRWRFARRQVIRVGAWHFLGGTIIRIPSWRLPLIDPPRASTMKLTRNLHSDNKGLMVKDRQKERKRDTTLTHYTDTKRVWDDSHAVITVHPTNLVKERGWKKRYKWKHRK